MKTIIIFFVSFVFACIGIISKKYLGDDNIIEELSEEIIKEEMGIDIDLSASSYEKDEDPKKNKP